MDSSTMVSIGLVVTIVNIAIAITTFLKNNKKETKQETKEEVASITKIDTKLDVISKNVDEIRLDNKEISRSLNTLAERVTAVEQSTKSAHHRIDLLETRK